MALALIPSFELQVTFAALDPEGVIRERSKVYAIVGADFAAAQANRDLFLADLALATGAMIRGHRLTERYGDAAAVVLTPNLYREMVITFELAGAVPKKATHTVIAPSANFANGKVLNLGHADVTAYVNNFLATGGIVTISDGEFVKDANNVADSYVRQVASGKSFA